MRTLRIWPLLAMLMSAFVGGCVPATFVNVPAVHGRIVDSAWRPVSDATVELVPEWPKDADRLLIPVATDGTFNRPEDSQDFLYIAGMDFGRPPTYSVVIYAAGKRIPTTQVVGGRRMFGNGPPSRGTDLGDLQLP